MMKRTHRYLKPAPDTKACGFDAPDVNTLRHESKYILELIRKYYKI